MTLEDLKKIYHSLNECDPDVEIFNWGPSYEFALKRKKEALAILKNEIKRLENV